MAEDQRQRLLAELIGPGGEFEIGTREVGGIPMRVYTGGPATLRDVVLFSSGYGARDFLVYQDFRCSYAEHFRLVAGLARCLREEYGLTSGDRVAIAMRNFPEWSVVFWAIQAAGLIAVPLNAWWTDAELRYGLTDSGAALVFADAERAALIGREIPVVAVRGGASVPGARSWSELMASLPADAELPDVAIEPDDDATIMYTSGTTGRPKGAVGTHRNHCTNLLNTVINRRVQAAVDNGGVFPPLGDPAAPQPGVLLTFPLFHIAGLTTLCFTTLAGVKLATLYRWDREEAGRLIVEEGLTSAAGVPTVMRDLVEQGEAVRRLEGVNMGGAPIPPDLVHRIGGLGTGVTPASGYGLTETTSGVVANAGDDYLARADSVGRCVPGADLRVVDPATGDDLPDGEIGELWFRGPNIVRGYWNNPQATAESFVDGWFRTGDLGYVVDGWVHVVDRLKDVVIRGGENVYCAEVEAALFEHPAVVDCAVIGLPHPKLGEEVAAVVNLRSEVDAAELQQHVAARLAAFKVPAHVVIRPEPLPRTQTGKVLKRQLRDHLGARGI
ncbi:Acyl-CoA synthetase (AMP-forming)/AMP-acid ligase II [Saccharopolyspora kobensis]|uniref:Acyl-CoA synthetase (AMP-forming)/AMP-acid ligase II n=1 Tax=Saccharopolyspora kobensis TaxID=146035 RepID=A0A1H5U8M7_9PSEU|nr:class I adenylate-forming enzyme family protein [Saccharopolyspora kobensis]SEF70701.1 Acyl-CoA synthetase (AMP-forming)/AMP-acid ligase II [Saccharopolyspora kobensis]SFC76681.1 Acyl-CoA synthetase (AMP-forming)/AMP-acid ligase II [Saccharopolyspora kobensis]